MQNAETMPSIWPYRSRTGTQTVHDVGRLIAEPESHLTDDERHSIGEFAAELVQGQRRADGTRLADLDSVSRMLVASDAHTFHPGYLSTEAGQQDMQQAGLTALAPDITAFAGQAAQGAVFDKKATRQMAVRSAEWNRRQFITQLGEPAETDADFVEPEAFSVNFNPGQLLAKLEALRAYRDSYRETYRSIKQADNSPLITAKRVLLNIHVAKVNSELATLYPHAFNLIEQLNASPETEMVADWTRRLATVLPGVGQVCRTPGTEPEYVADHLDNFARRLDLIRNGAAADPKSTEFSPISRQLLDMVSSFSASGSREQIASRFERSEVEHMAAQRWQAPEVQTFLESVLTDWNLLSEHTADWQEIAERGVSAPDKRWQVVVTPKERSLTVNGVKKVVLVPDDFDRTLVQQTPSGGLPVVAHETTHVLQNEADEQLARILPLAKLKGRGHLVMREMGGQQSEREVYSAFGMPRPAKLIYLRGLQAKRAGGNRAEVIRATYKAREDKDTTDEQTARKSAVNQAERLYRNRRHNSQPLDYLESELLADALRQVSEDKRRAITTRAASFALDDLAALHAVDLLHLSDTADKRSPAETVLRLYLQTSGQDGS